jgi:hypothetical protein
MQGQRGAEGSISVLDHFVHYSRYCAITWEILLSKGDEDRKSGSGGGSAVTRLTARLNAQWRVRESDGEARTVTARWRATRNGCRLLAG